jgi:Small protein A (tmRNA-binding)
MKKTIVKKIIVLSAAAVCLTAFSSCAYKEMDRNKKNLASIRVGMDRAQVLKIMGEPVKNETYCSEKVYFYYTGQKWMDGLVTRDECTPIAFDDYGKVIGWGPGFGTGVYHFVPEK